MQYNTYHKTIFIYQSFVLEKTLEFKYSNLYLNLSYFNVLDNSTVKVKLSSGYTQVETTNTYSCNNIHDEVTIRT